VPAEVLNGLVRSILLRNRAFEWVDVKRDRAQSARFYAEIDDFMKTFEMRAARLAKLYPDTLETLMGLAAGGVEMGLVTNTSREAADYILGKLRLKRFFRVVVTRNDAPRLKPDPAMIQVAAAKMGEAVGWLVGDTAFDAEAAGSAGMKSIIIRRDGVHPSFNHDYFVSSLNDVASIVFNG